MKRFAKRILKKIFKAGNTKNQLETEVYKVVGELYALLIKSPQLSHQAKYEVGNYLEEMMWRFCINKKPFSPKNPDLLNPLMKYPHRSRRPRQSAYQEQALHTQQQHPPAEKTLRSKEEKIAYAAQLFAEATGIDPRALLKPGAQLIFEKEQQQTGLPNKVAQFPPLPKKPNGINRSQPIHVPTQQPEQTQ